MSTYCRITGKSRGLPKPNYFPLLPPISPADAKRLCRITGKSYGLPSHHYIPVLVGFRKQPRVPCHITTKSEGQEPHHYYAGVVHTVLKEYKYVFPKLDNTSSDLVELLKTKSLEGEHNYVYTVKERRCSLVFPGSLEAAVRDGDVRDVMLAKDSGTLLLKLRKGQSVEVDVAEISVDGMQLYEGEGPNEEVVEKRTRAKKRRDGGNNWRRKVFEDKEQAEENEQKPKPVKKAKMKLNTIKEAETYSWKNVISSSKILGDVEVFENIAKLTSEKVLNGELSSVFDCKGTPVICEVPPKPTKISPEIVDLSSSLPGIIQQPTKNDHFGGLPVNATCLPFKPLIANVNKEIEDALKIASCPLGEKMRVQQELLEKNPKSVLTVFQLPEIASSLDKALEIYLKCHDVPEEFFALPVDISTGQISVTGQLVKTTEGPVFVPGVISDTGSGAAFVPGFTVQAEDGFKLIPGRVVTDEENGGKVFVTGQTLLTREGEKFVQGQVVNINEGPKFMPGQTVICDGILSFVPGQVVEEKGGEHRFVPGRIMMMPHGPQFVPGLFRTNSDKELTFVAGQRVFNEDLCEWDFVPGQVTKSKSGWSFVPGKTVATDEGSYFVPGIISQAEDRKVFVPGVVAEDSEGSANFLPGLKVNTMEGEKFVEGFVLENAGKLCFAPGSVTRSAEGSVSFSTASSMDDVLFHDVPNFDVLTNPASAFAENGDEVFGHMVQSTEGVEFFPGTSAGLPAGNVVPGKLIRGAEMRFIPGTMMEGKFVPGQVVMTDKGEQFVPGQVVETADGPKFVPGQILETKSGPKFVPGQTVETAEGAKFIPGQIVETKAGPTFIPGQVITTEEEGSRFVPGQVVDTAEGPRFVPGRLIETGDHVTFIPAEIVDTEKGLKFVAPDLEDDPDGGCQFTVQSFEVTKEELQMLQKNSLLHAKFNSLERAPAINSTMLKQLANAGVSIGREAPVYVPEVNISSSPIAEMACKLAEKLKINATYSIKLSHILSNIQQLSVATGSSLDDCEDDNLKILLNAVTELSVHSDFLISLSDMLEEVINLEPTKKMEVIDTLHAASSELLTKVKNPNAAKLSLLKKLASSEMQLGEATINKLISLLNKDEMPVCSAFQHIVEENPELLGEVLKKVEQMLENMSEEQKASDTLHRAIIKTVTEASECSVQEALNSKDGEEFKSLVLEAVGLARALGMTEVANSLADILSDAKSIQILAQDKITLDVLKRLTIMRQLTRKRPHLGNALNALKSDPYLARKDPRLRELVRESAALMVVPEESVVLKSSSDVPASLLFGDNSLAMEDFMARSGYCGTTFLIIKRGMQAVIPKEAARSVLTGRVPYTVLDENGIHFFEPLHVFSALKLPQFATDRFSTYGGCSSQSMKNSSDRTSTGTSSVVSFENFRRNFENNCVLTEEVN